MANNVYDREKVLEIIVEYFFKEYRDGDLSVPFGKLYAQIVQYASVSHQNIRMPAVSQARKIIISELKEHGLFKDTDKLTSETVCRLTELYYDDENVEEAFQHEYQVFIYSDNPIIFTIRLPHAELLNHLAEGISTEKNKSLMWGRIKLIYDMCKKIKRKNPKLILAVIPEFNRMVYLNQNGKIRSDIHDLNPICDTLCIFVRNTADGRALIEKMKNPPQSLNDLTEEL